MSDAAGALFLAARIIFVIQFFDAGIAHLRRQEQMIGYSRGIGFPLPVLAGWPSGIWLLLAALSVSLGIWPDVGSLMLALWTIPTALYFHAFWRAQDPAQKPMARMLSGTSLTSERPSPCSSSSPPSERLSASRSRTRSSSCS
jgi:uncharacterized membrane protein YphA (DoxX/SURF4 family)